MVAIPLFGDAWSVLLMVGITATFLTTVAMIIGWTPNRRGDRKVLVREVEPPTPWRVSSASTVRERAAAAARVKAQASVRERGLQLTDVREIPASTEADQHGTTAAPASRPATDPADPAGRTDDDVDRLRARFDRDVTADEARAIASEAVQQQPNRVAEVITEWIRSDLKNKARRSH